MIAARSPVTLHSFPAPRPILRLVTTAKRTEPDSDESLLPRIATGDERALGALYDRHCTISYSLALAILKEPADAEEAVGDTFAQIWRAASDFDSRRGSVPGWIATITRSRALDQLRTRKRTALMMDQASAAHDVDANLFSPNPLATPDEDAESGELRVQVQMALAELPATQREVLELAYFGGLSQSEIATRLGQPLGTVKTRVRSAMDKLRLVLAPVRSQGDM